MNHRSKNIVSFICAIHKRPPALLLGALLAASPIFAPSAMAAEGGDCRSEVGAVNVNLTRLRHISWVGGWTDAPGFGTHFSDGGINETDLRDIYVAKVWEPAPANVKNIVVVSAGQSFTEGVHNSVTGQNKDYKWSDDPGATFTHAIAGNSMAKKIMGRFDPSDTVMILIFDSQFEYENTSTQRTAVKNAFRNWLYSLADDPELFYWVGSSRGGALGLMIGADLTNAASFPKFNDTNFLLQGIDPVFRHGEFGVNEHWDKIQNPFETSMWSSWKAQELDIKAQFGDDIARIGRTMTKVITTGDQVVTVAEGALPWGEWSTGAARSGDNESDVLRIIDDNGHTFYEGNWVNIAHKPLGRNYCTGPSEETNQVAFRDNNLLHHLDNALARFACNGTWNYSCDIRTGCPAAYFTCLCDTPYVSDGAGSCMLDCADGEYYDADADACLNICDPEENLAFDAGSGTCVCAEGAHWSPEEGCVMCPDSDWDYYNQTCCPSSAPEYDHSYNECFADCGPDAYWEFDDYNNLGHCEDYCAPCFDPRWDTVCDAKTRTCNQIMVCEPQCDEGETCGTTPHKFGYDMCIEEMTEGPVEFDDGAQGGGTTGTTGTTARRR